MIKAGAEVEELVRTCYGDLLNTQMPHRRADMYVLADEEVHVMANRIEDRGQV